MYFPSSNGSFENAEDEFSPIAEVNVDNVAATAVRDWLADNVWIILGICLLAHLAISIRILVAGLSFIGIQSPDQFPEEMPVPLDAWIGYGVIAFVACASITLAVLLQHLSLLSVIVAIVIDAIVLSIVYASILAPSRAYKATIRSIRSRRTDGKNEES